MANEIINSTALRFRQASCLDCANRAYRVNRNVTKSRVMVVCLMLCLVAACVQADERNVEKKNISTLPSDIVKKLRGRNTPGERSSCDESNIFIHGFEYVGYRLDRLIWFLGAPDYLCETNSFIPVIVDRSGNWTAGENSEEDWQGSNMLAGVPVLFKHEVDLGFFLTSEWQVEGPGNFLYYSANGVTWTSLDLPAPIRKSTEYDCCDAASIKELCIEKSGSVYIAYEEDSEFDASTWEAPVDSAFPQKTNWSRVPNMPEGALCDGRWPRAFLPQSLREKTRAGALFDVAYDWTILIPGPTK